MDGPQASPINWETGMNSAFSSSRAFPASPGFSPSDLAERIEGSIDRRACGRIRDLLVVCSEDAIIVQGRSRTYHDKQLAHQAVLDLTDGHPLLTNLIVVS